jgi:hypothetical protein
MIPMLYQLSYASRMFILAMPLELSNPGRRVAKYKVTTTKDQAMQNGRKSELRPFHFSPLLCPYNFVLRAFVCILGHA